MLQQKPTDMTGKVVTLMAANGMEIIGKLISQNEHEYHLSNPMVLMVQENGVDLRQVTLSGDNKNVVFTKSLFAVIDLTKDQMANAYTQSTGGLIQPPKLSV